MPHADGVLRITTQNFRNEAGVQQGLEAEIVGWAPIHHVQGDSLNVCALYVAGDVQAQAEDSLPKPSSFCALGESVSEQLADLERDQLPLLENGDVGRMRSH